MVSFLRGKIMLISFLSGLFSLFALFVLCVLLVVGAKSLYYSLKSNTKTKDLQKPALAKTHHKKSQTRNLSIDTDKIEKIYFKKSS